MPTSRSMPLKTLYMLLALAGAIVMVAFTMPAVASAQSATGCPGTIGPPRTGGCDFTSTGGGTPGATQFQVNPNGAIVTCDDSKANAITDGSDVVDVKLIFEGNCLAAGSLPTTVECDSTPITIDSVSSPGNATGRLNLGQNDCTINVLSGLCVIETSATSGGQDIDVSVTGADATPPPSVLTVGVLGNTDALTFTASAGCSIAGVPTAGTATFSNVPPKSGSAFTDIEYTEVGNNLDVS